MIRSTTIIALLVGTVACAPKALASIAIMSSVAEDSVRLPHSSFHMPSPFSGHRERDDDETILIQSQVIADPSDSTPDPSSSVASSAISGVFSTTTGNVSTSPESTELSASFGQSREQWQYGDIFSVGRYEVVFVPDVNMLYSITESMPNPVSYTQMSSTLMDLALLTPLQSSQHTARGPAAGFIAGAATTDAGAVTGTLLAGHQYVWSVESRIGMGTISNNGTMTQDNSISLTLEPANAVGSVPEPTALGIWSLLVVLGVSRVWYGRFRRRWATPATLGQ